jgi:hypothetical protein
MAVAGGVLMGLVSAMAGTYGWRLLARRADPPIEEARAVQVLDLFRLPSGARREMFLVPAGPDGIGEPGLAASLFPDEDPPRELASLLVANVSAEEPWRVDLEGQSLRCRAEGDPSWRPIERLPAAPPSVSAAEALRLRGLGAGDAAVTVEPRSLRQVLLALPRGCRFSALSDVQWGTTPLVRDKLDAERIRHFREDPAAATTGR